MCLELNRYFRRRSKQVYRIKFNGEKEEQKEELILQFDVESGTEPRVNASAVGKSIAAIDAIFSDLHEEFKKNSELLLKARPFRQASLDIPIDVIIVTTVALTSFPILENILRCLSEYFRLKRELRGLTPQLKEGKLVIENNTIEVDKVVINLLDPRNESNKLVARAFEEIEKDKNVTGLNVSWKKERIASVKREEFKYYGPPAMVELPSKETRVKAVLDVVGPIFADKGKWTFQREGKRIHADILDDNFIKKRVLEKKESFRSGDQLRVELSVLQEYDPTMDVYVDKEYKVEKIVEHIQRRETGELF
jgi:hypothetical protein